MKIKGYVAHWDNEQGNGTIKNEQGESFFFQKSEFRALRKPNLNEEVVFLQNNNNGAKEAYDIQELAFVQRQSGIKQKKKDAEDETKIHLETPKKKVDLTSFITANLITSLLVLALLAVLAIIGWAYL